METIPLCRESFGKHEVHLLGAIIPVCIKPLRHAVASDFGPPKHSSFIVPGEDETPEAKNVLLPRTEEKLHHKLPWFMDPNLGMVHSLEKPVESKVKFFKWQADRMSQIPSLPDDEDVILVFSGIDTTEPWNYFTSSAMLMFSFRRQDWDYCCSLPEPRCYAAACTVGTTIYISGGYSPLDIEHGDMRPSAMTFSFCVKSQIWKKHPDMNVARASHAAVAFTDKVFVFGGCGRDGCILSSVEMYDPMQDTWKIVCYMPETRFGLSACCSGDEIWIVGGMSSEYRNASDCILSSVYTFSPEAKSWKVQPSLTAPRAFASCVAVGNDIWVVGGSTLLYQEHHLVLHSISSVEVLSKTDRRWQRYTDLSFPRHSFALAHDGSEIYVVGGMSSETLASCSDVECMSLENGDSFRIQPLPLRLAGCCAAFLPRRSKRDVAGSVLYQEEKHTQHSPQVIKKGYSTQHVEGKYANQFDQPSEERPSPEKSLTSHADFWVHEQPRTYKETLQWKCKSHKEPVEPEQQDQTGRPFSLNVPERSLSKHVSIHAHIPLERYAGVLKTEDRPSYSYPFPGLTHESAQYMSLQDQPWTGHIEMLPSRHESLLDFLQPKTIHDFYTVKPVEDQGNVVRSEHGQFRQQPEISAEKVMPKFVDLPDHKPFNNFSDSKKIYLGTEPYFSTRACKSYSMSQLFPKTLDKSAASPPSTGELKKVSKYELYFPRRAKQYRSVLEVYLEPDRHAERFQDHYVTDPIMSGYCRKHDDIYSEEFEDSMQHETLFRTTLDKWQKVGLEQRYSKWTKDKHLTVDLGQPLYRAPSAVLMQGTRDSGLEKHATKKRKYFRQGYMHPYGIQPFPIRVQKRIFLQEANRFQAFKYDPMLGLVQRAIHRLEIMDEKPSYKVPPVVTGLHKSVFTPDLTIPSILLVGGMNPCHPYEVTMGNVILRFHLLKNRFEYAGRMPEQRCNHAMVFFDDAMFVIGGCDPDVAYHGEMAPTSSVMAYDFKERRWTRCSDMSHCRSFHGGVVADGKIFVLGGRDDCGSALASVESYDKYENRWRECLPLPYPVMGAAVCVNDPCIFVIGGVADETDQQQLTSNVIIYDTSLESWTYGPPLPIPVAYASAVWCMNSVCLIGGLTVDEMCVMSLSEIWILDSETDQWQHLVNMSVPRHLAVAVAVESCIYVMGGMSTTLKNAVNVSEIILCHEREISSVKHLPIPMTAMSALVLPPCVMKAYSQKRIDSMIKSIFKWKKDRIL